MYRLCCGHYLIESNLPLYAATVLNYTGCGKNQFTPSSYVRKSDKYAQRVVSTVNLCACSLLSVDTLLITS